MFTNIKNNVVKLITKAGNATSWNAHEVLKTAMNEVKPTDKVMVLYTDSTTGEYRVNFIQCGMTDSSMITLLEVAKLNIYTNLMTKQKAPE